MTRETKYVIGLLCVAISGSIFDFFFVHSYDSFVAAILVNTLGLCFQSLILGGIIFGIIGIFTKRFTFVRYIQISIATCLALILYIASMLTDWFW
jgi:hypothetical protein